MKAKGLPIPDFPKAAHHIVAIHAEAAEATRTLLAEYGIGEKELNSAANGVFLPTDPLDNPGNSTLHIGSHKESYHVEVYKYLSEGIRSMEEMGIEVNANHIYGLIDDLRQELLSGKLKLN